MEWCVKGTYYSWARLPYYGTGLILDVETTSPEENDEAAAIGRMLVLPSHPNSPPERRPRRARSGAEFATSAGD